MSPIESKLLRALLDCRDDRFGFWYEDGWYGQSADDVQEVCIEANAAAAQYRCDFLLSIAGGDEFRLAIECDGHDFHDRTKQQAAYDRSRDRELFALGVFTIRFTGSEIHHSAERCVSDVLRCLTVVAGLCLLRIDGWRAGYDSGRASVLGPPRTSSVEF